MNYWLLPSPNPNPRLTTIHKFYSMASNSRDSSPASGHNGVPGSGSGSAGGYDADSSGSSAGGYDGRLSESDPSDPSSPDWPSLVKFNLSQPSSSLLYQSQTLQTLLFLTLLFLLLQVFLLLI